MRYQKQQQVQQQQQNNREGATSVRAFRDSVRPCRPFGVRRRVLVARRKVINAPFLLLELILECRRQTAAAPVEAAWRRNGCAAITQSEPEAAIEAPVCQLRRRRRRRRRVKRARLKGFRHNLFDVCYVFSNNSSVLCSLQSFPSPKLLLLLRQLLAKVWRVLCGYFWAKIVECSFCKVCAKKKRMSFQLNETIVKTIATIVAIVDIATIVSIAKL